MLYKKRVLIIDASDSARTILFKRLQGQMPDVDVIACGTAREALTATNRFQFEIITSGLSLPDMDGFALIDQIRAQIKNRDTPIFVVSGDTRTHIVDVNNEEAHTVTAYFDKSDGYSALVNFIDDFIHRENPLYARILYVDGSATSAAITNSILEKNHLEHITVRDGAKALDELRADFAKNQGCSFDLMITDLVLDSKMSGFALIQSVRKELGYDYLTLPILLMTVEPGAGEKTDFTGIFGAGTNDFITKPISEEKLIERISNLINIKRQNDALNS